MAIDNIIARFELQTGQAQTEIRELTARLDAMDKELKQVGKDGKKGFDDVRKGAENAGGGINSLKSQLTSFAATMGVAFGAQEIISFTRASIDAAADMGETISKVGVIFAENAADIEAWAGTAAERLGQSKQQALDAASTFAIFGKSAGKTGTDLSGFAMEMTELATDLASFHNTSPQEAIEALGATFRGEMEPIRKYGIVLDDMSLRQIAVSENITNNIKEALTPQQKILAAHAAIMRKTNLEQGDFAKTSESLSNKQKILSAEFANFQVELGQKLAPAFEKIVDLAGDMLEGLDPDTVLSFAKAIGVAGLAFGAFKFGAFIQGIGGATGAIKGMRGAVVGLGRAVMANPLGLLLSAMTALAVYGTPVVKSMLGMSEALDDIEDSARKATEGLRKEQIEMNNLFEALKKTNPESEERNKLVDEINATYGTTLSNQGSEIANLGMLESAQRKLNDEYKRKIEVRLQEARLEAAIQKQIELEQELQKQTESTFDLLMYGYNFGGPLSDNMGIGQTLKELDRVKALIDELGQQGVQAPAGAAALSPEQLAALDAERKAKEEAEKLAEERKKAAQKAYEDRIKQLEDLEKAVQDANYEILEASLNAQDQELLAVEKKYKAQIDLAKQYANDSTAEGRRYAAVLAALQKASETEALEIQKKYAGLRELARIDALNKEREAEKKRAEERMEFLRQEDEDYVIAYEDAVNELLKKYDKQAITYEEFLKRMAKLDADYAENVKKNAQGVTDEKQKATQQLMDAILQSTQLFGETLTNIMSITGRNSSAFVQFQKFVGLAEIAISKGVAIANAIKAISSTSLNPIALIAQIATITASITSIFAGLAQTISQAQAPEVPEMESYNKGTPYLERGGNPRGIDTIPIMANEGEAIIPTGENAKYPGMARAWINGNLDDYIFRNYVIPQLEEQAASAAAARMEAFGVTSQGVAGFDDFRLFTQARRQTGALEAIVENTNPKRQSRKRYYS
jgi:hypothetical protein